MWDWLGLITGCVHPSSNICFGFFLFVEIGFPWPIRPSAPSASPSRLSTALQNRAERHQFLHLLLLCIAVYHGIMCLLCPRLILIFTPCPQPRRRTTPECQRRHNTGTQGDIAPRQSGIFVGARHGAPPLLPFPPAAWSPLRRCLRRSAHGASRARG